MVVSSSTEASEKHDTPHYTSRPGGYASIADLRAERVVAAAAFAVQSLRSDDFVNSMHYSFLSKLKEEEEKDDMTITVVQGSQQVVAGMNYQLTLVLSDSTRQGDEIIGAFVVTVYDKFGSLSLTNWGREVPLTEAKSLLENVNQFGEASKVAEEENVGDRRV